MLMRVTHSDNTCTVGWTSIHACMRYEDACALMAIVDGHFTPTCYVQCGFWHKPGLAVLKYWTGIDPTGLKHFPAYFTFNPVLFYFATGYEKLISSTEKLRFLRGWLLVVIRKL